MDLDLESLWSCMDRVQEQGRTGQVMYLETLMHGSRSRIPLVMHGQGARAGQDRTGNVLGNIDAWI